uniref:Ryanodine receptor 3 n=1 Tax=Papio anubis TaxID=9555 RepID=A0A8I5R935_PAPAN
MIKQLTFGHSRGTQRPSGIQVDAPMVLQNSILPSYVEDEVVLQCIATIHKEQRKFCLAAEGLGNRLCFLEPTSEAKYIPPDLCVCNFVLEQSLSVRALQEMLANTGENGGEGAAQGGGHRTLLYGHAILLRHSFSGMVSSSGVHSHHSKRREN